MVFRRKNRICQDALGRITAQQKIFFRFPLQYRTAQVIQPTRFLFLISWARDRISDAAVPHSSSGACFRPRSFSSLHKYAALRTSQFKLAPAVFLLRDLRCDFPDSILGGG